MPIFQANSITPSTLEVAASPNVRSRYLMAIYIIKWELKVRERPHSWEQSYYRRKRKVGERYMREDERAEEKTDVKVDEIRVSS